MQKIWLYGTGGHAAVITDMILSMQCFEIAGFVDDNVQKQGKMFYKQAMVYSPADFLQKNARQKIRNLFFAIGDNAVRKNLAQQFSDFNFPTIIHPSAMIGKFVKIECGTVVMPYAIVETEAVIGEHGIINNNAIIGHHSIIRPYCHIGGRVVLSGGTRVGQCCLIGVGASVPPLTVIGDHCTIGTGSVVTRNVPDHSFMFGNPARQISNFLVRE